MSISMIESYNKRDINASLTEDEKLRLNYLSAKDEVYDLTEDEQKEIRALFDKRNKPFEA